MALKDSDAGVRRQAAAALGAAGSRRAVPGLIELAEGPPPDVRQRAQSARSAQIGDRGRGPALRDALKDSRSAHARRAPRPRSARSATQRGRTADRAGARQRRRRAHARHRRARRDRRRPRAVEALTAALKDADAGVRLRAVRALADLTDGGGGRAPRPRPRPVVRLDIQH